MKDLLELELDNTLRDLQGYVLQARNNASKFTPYYYEIIDKMGDAVAELSRLAANAEMPANFLAGA